MNILKKAVLCFMIRSNQVLLALKTGNIGHGRWNGYGGFVENNENITNAMIRELFEESGVIAIEENLCKCAIITLRNVKKQGKIFDLEVHIFLLEKWQGDPGVSLEMAFPTWFDVIDLPVKFMLPSDEYWLPRVLNGEKLICEFVLDLTQEVLPAQMHVFKVDNFE